MLDITEQVEMKFNGVQNEELEVLFREFYKLTSSQKIIRKLVVPIEEYRKFVKGRAKARTQFEANTEFNLNFDSGHPPFKFIATQTEFIMPSGKSINVYEMLTEPNGLTKDVKVGDQIFTSYFQAETYVLGEFLMETNGDNN